MRHWLIWTYAANQSRKLDLDRARDEFLSTVVAVWRELDLDEPDLLRLERLKNIEHLSWIRYRQILDRSPR